MSTTKFQTTKSGTNYAKINFDERELQLLSFISEQKKQSVDDILSLLLSEFFTSIEGDFQKFLIEFYTTNKNKSENPMDKMVTTYAKK